MVSIRRRWYSLRCQECRSIRGLKRIPGYDARWRCRFCGKIVGKNPEAYTKWVIDYTDSAGKRHLETCPRNWSKREARLRAAELEKEPASNPSILFETVCREWLSRCLGKVAGGRLRQQSYNDYRRKVNHILPRLGRVKIKDISRAMILDLLVEKLTGGLAPRTVSEIRGRMHAIFQYAIAVDYIAKNPMLELSKDLALTPASRVDTVLSLNDEEREILMQKAAELDPEFFPILFTLDRAGLRVGELSALMPEDVDLDRRDLHVSRTRVGPGVQEKPKSKAGERVVDMSRELCDMLASVMLDRNKKRLSAGWVHREPYLFLNRYGRGWQTSKIAARFKVIVRAAGLPEHFTPHSMRHTFARRHLELGATVEWLSRQMGHKRIGITFDLYGKWAKMSDKAAADRLDDGYKARQRRLDWEA